MMEEYIPMNKLLCFTVQSGVLFAGLVWCSGVSPK
jgi:hypothetical protein